MPNQEGRSNKKRAGSTREMRALARLLLRLADAPKEHALQAVVRRSSSDEGKPLLEIRNFYIPPGIRGAQLYYRFLPYGLDSRLVFHCIEPGQANRPAPKSFKIEEPGLEVELHTSEAQEATPMAHFRNIPIPVGSTLRVQQVNFADGFQLSLRWGQAGGLGGNEVAQF